MRNFPRKEYIVFNNLILKILGVISQLEEEIKSIYGLDSFTLAQQGISQNISSRNKFLKSFYCLSIHLISLLRISISIIFSKQNSKIVVSNLRWSNRTESYKQNIENIINNEKKHKLYFVFLNNFFLIPHNKIYLKIRYSLKKFYLENFESIFSKLYKEFEYTSSLRNPEFKSIYNFALKKKHLIYKYLSKDIENSTSENILINYFSRVIIKILELLFKIINWIIIHKKLQLIFINTNVWTNSFVFFDYLASLPKKNLLIYGCQHGGNYFDNTVDKKIQLSCGYEIGNPVIEEFISFRKRPPLINPCNILNMQKNGPNSEIVYIDFLSWSDLYDYDDEKVLNFIIKLFKEINQENIKITFRIHPYSKNQRDNRIKGNLNLPNLKFFKAKDKSIGLNPKNKLGIFYNAGSTLYEIAYYLDMNIIFIQDEIKAYASSIDDIKIYKETEFYNDEGFFLYFLEKVKSLSK